MTHDIVTLHLPANRQKRPSDVDDNHTFPITARVIPIPAQVIDGWKMTRLLGCFAVVITWNNAIDDLKTNNNPTLKQSFKGGLCSRKHGPSVWNATPERLVTDDGLDTGNTTSFIHSTPTLRVHALWLSGVLSLFFSNWSVLSTVIFQEAKCNAYWPFRLCHMLPGTKTSAYTTKSKDITDTGTETANYTVLPIY
jgi:hypothetical protein